MLMMMVFALRHICALPKLSRDPRFITPTKKKKEKRKGLTLCRAKQTYMLKDLALIDAYREMSI